MTAPSSEHRDFDAYAANYEQALDRGISVSGEDINYFARGRIAWLAHTLQQLRESPRSVLDFGCGTGTATPFFFELLRVESVLGVDVSPRSVEAARQNYGSERARFVPLAEYQPAGKIDLAFCNGVFHHIPIAERVAAIRYMQRSLRPGGLFAFWENNPWNPGTRYVMWRIPFDRDAIPLAPPQARELARQGGFEVITTTFQFIFPRTLSWLRGLEPPLARCPFGAQYQVLCREAGRRDS